MSIMSIFQRLSGNVPAPQQNPAHPNAAQTNNTVPNSTTVTADGNVPGIPKTPTGTESPLDAFKDLWEPPKTGSVDLPNYVPNLNADPTKLTEIASKIDFSGAINPELFTKATSGDAAALMEVINQAGRSGFAQSAGTTAQVVQRALAAQAETFRNEFIPELLRRNEVGNALRENNPLYTDPATRPMIENLERQLSAKFPTASPQEIKTHAMNYMDGMAQRIAALSGKSITAPVASPTGRTNAEPDWDVWGGTGKTTDLY